MEGIIKFLENLLAEIENPASSKAILKLQVLEMLEFAKQRKDESRPVQAGVMEMLTEFVDKHGMDCISCDNSGVIIFETNGEPEPAPCEFCYTTINSKFNLRNDIEKLLNTSKHSA